MVAYVDVVWGVHVPAKTCCKVYVRFGLVRVIYCSAPAMLRYQDASEMRFLFVRMPRAWC